MGVKIVMIPTTITFERPARQLRTPGREELAYRFISLKTHTPTRQYSPPAPLLAVRVFGGKASGYNDYTIYIN